MSKRLQVWKTFRQALLNLGISLVFGLFAVSCSPLPGNPAGPGRAAPAQTPAADLVAAVPRGTVSQALETALQAYSQAGLGQVRVVVLGEDAYLNQVNAALLAGLDAYDLVYLPADSLAKWAAYHTIVPLTAPPSAADMAPWLPAMQSAGQLFGLPTQPDGDVLWYRADLLQSAGLSVPMDWAAFHTAARALNAPPERYGAAIAAGDMDAGADFNALLVGFGGQAVSPAGQVLVNNATGQAALDFYTRLRQPDALVPPQADRATRADVLNALRTGRAAMGILPASAGPQLLDCTGAPAACQAGQSRLAWARLPGTPETEMVGTLGAWVIPLHASHAPAARRLAAWLTGPDGARAWAKGGGTPASRSVLAAGKAPLDHLLQPVETFRLAFPPLPGADLLWNASQSAAHAAAAGEKPVNQALEDAATTMQKALHQGGD